MKFGLKATSIAEAMVSMTIIVLGVTGMYNIYFESIRLSESIENKIQAIQIAREGLEGAMNIRDTNWVIFTSDYLNCWMVKNYDSLCISDTGTSRDIENNTPYLIYQDSSDRWYLTGATLGNFASSQSYRENNRIFLDSNDFYTHSGALIGYTGAISQLQPVFTRTLTFNYIDLDLNGVTSNDQKVEVTSLVEWADKSSPIPHKVELKTTLSNWIQ